MLSKEYLDNKFKKEVEVACGICEEFMWIGNETSGKVLELLSKKRLLEFDLGDFLLKQGAVSLLTALGYIEQHWSPGKNVDTLNLVLTPEGEKAIIAGMDYIRTELERIVPEPTDGKIEDEYVNLDNGEIIHVYRKIRISDTPRLQEPVIIDA